MCLRSRVVVSIINNVGCYEYFALSLFSAYESLSSESAFDVSTTFGASSNSESILNISCTSCTAVWDRSQLRLRISTLSIFRLTAK